MPHHFQLVVGQSQADDNDELTEDDFDTEKCFLLDHTIRLSLTQRVDEAHQDLITTILSWVDLSSDDSSDIYEFVVDSSHPECSSDKIDFFEDVAYRCMWERSNGRDSTDAPQDELDAFRIVNNPPLDESTHHQPLFREPTPESESDADVQEEEPEDVEASDQDDDDLSGSVGTLQEELESESDTSDQDIAQQLRATSLSSNTQSPRLSNQSANAPPSSRKPVAPVDDRNGKTRDHQTTTNTSSASTFASPARTHTGSTRSPLRSKPTKATTSSSTEATQSSEQTNERAFTSQIQADAIVSDSAHQPKHDGVVCVWVATCELWLFDSKEFAFVPQQAGVEASLWTAGPQMTNSVCWLSVLGPAKTPGDESEIWVSTNIGPEQSLRFSEGSIVFNYTYEVEGTSESRAYTWCLKFPDDEVSRDVYTHAQDVFAKALFERDNGHGSWDKLATEIKSWNRQAYGVIVEADEDVEMAEAEAEAEALEQESDDSSDDGSAQSDEEDENAQRFRGKKGKTKSGLTKQSGGGDQNSGLVVGYKENLSFVTRGNMIGVFRNEANGSTKLKFLASIENLMTPDGKRVIRPQQMMLHQQDSTIVIKDPLNPNALYNLDLETGKIVEEWKISDSLDITNFIPKTKFAQMNPEATFLGTSHNSLFAVDPRLSGAKMVADQIKTYASKTDFSCAVTTEAGYVAVGSNKGEIRLYDQVGKNAKTMLPGIRDPIIGIDTSKDGKYAIATCSTYLTFVDLQIRGESKSKGFTGYERSFPMKEKPDGFRVELKPEHRAFIASQNVPIRFTEARFNHGPETIEKTIVTSMGPFIIAFNLRKLKLNQVDYTLKKYGEDVVADGFKWDTDREIVVTMASDVFIENRKKLAKPDRHSLAGVPYHGRGGSGLNQDVVQHWGS